jgi:RNA polymerase sigma-70 factor (ECF subfamily)
MNTTSKSLLDQIRLGANQQAWERFVKIYTPLLFFWARRFGCNQTEADDLVQDIMTALVAKLPQFHYDPAQTFRGWLRTVAVNKWRERRRKPGVSALAHEPAQEDPAEAFWDHEYKAHLVRRALTVMQSDFEESTWKACWLTVVEGHSGAEAAKLLNTTPGAIAAARFRVLTRLREELAGVEE